MQVADRIQIRRDTAANWTSASPTLANGELGLETDTGRLKVGDGSTIWTSLSYYTLGTTGAAMYSDATANFTGTLQQGGSNVVVDSDIGSTVQAHDANLTSFVGAVDLPVADGLSGQVLTTDGAGGITFADAAGGVSFTTYNKGTTADIPLRASYEINNSLNVSSPSYVQLWRVGAASGSNHTVGNTFTWLAGCHTNTSGTHTSLTACGFVCTPSTKTITVTTPSSAWTNNSGYGFSTWQGTGCEGGGEVIGHGNIALPTQTSYVYGHFRVRQQNTDGQNSSTGWNPSGYGHHSNEPHYSLPIDASGATYALITGYNNSNYQSGYEVYYGAGNGSNGSVGSTNNSPNTNTSTTSAATMFTHPLITNAGLFPNSSNNLPTHFMTYGTAGGYSKLGVNYSGQTSGELTSGFDRTQYNAQYGFLVKDPNSNAVKVYSYDYYDYISEWTAYNSISAIGQNNALPFTITTARYGLVPTGNLNEYMTIASGNGYPYGFPPFLWKFTIDYSTGKFTNFKVASIQSNTDFMSLNKSYIYLKALYGDNYDISSPPTHLLVSGMWAGNKAMAFICDYPADSEFQSV